MLTPDEELESRANGPEPRPCRNCNGPEGFPFHTISRECLTTDSHYEPATAEDFLDQEKI